jgi:hypothetical protein
LTRNVKNTEIAQRMSDPTVLGLGHDGSPAAARRSLPLSLPPRLVDTAVVVLLGLLYAGYVVGNVLTLRGWTPHLVAVAVAWQRASSGDWAAYAAEVSRRGKKGRFRP